MNNDSISRRDLLKLGGIAAATVAGAGALASSAYAAGSGSTSASAAASGSADGTFESTIDWAAEYDVIVAGFGGAGACSAITAADNGAKVLLCEKAPEGYAGGNSQACMQWLCYGTDKDGVMTYFKNLRGSYEEPTDDMLSVYTDGLLQNLDWFTSLGAPAATPFDRLEFPEFDGSSSFTPFTVDGYTGMSDTGFGGDKAAYRLMKQNVVDRADMIDVWYEAPAAHIIQDPATKIVHGLVINVDGQDLNVRAKNGVILTCGGFENSPIMQQNYTERTFWPSTGNAHYNTGDGINIGLEAGAALWHMCNVVTNIEFVEEEQLISTFGFRGAGKGIQVGLNGKRFRNESGSGRHGKYNVGGTWLNACLPDYFWSIFDETARAAGKVHFTWSDDSQEEIDKGWITKADTIEDLATAIGLDPATLSAEVDKWNGFVAGGEDIAFGRDPKAMVAVQTPPFYAVKLTPAMGNTQGGPKKNEKGEVLDVNGNPIPHLYESGELGDIWSNLYQASCNLGGGAIFGRISGANAAAAKDDNFQGSVMDGKENYAPKVEEPTYEAGDNQYIGSALGRGGKPIVLRVTMDGDKIANIEILESWETPVISDRAIAIVPQEIIDANSTAVDTVAGVTMTSAGIIAAVDDALSQIK